MKNNLLALAGAAVGGALGYVLFFWIYRQGFYALVLPGALLGVGAGVVKNRALWLAVACGIAATALGVFTEFRRAPFVKDESLTYFLTHIFDNPPLTLLMIALGGFVGFWCPFRRWEPRGRMM